MNLINRVRGTAVAVLGVLILSSAPVFAQQMGDAAAGERIFNRCKGCHQTGPDASNGVGPALNGVVCRPIGSVEGYGYSGPMEATAEQGGNWTVAELNKYLENPSEYLGGRSKMGLKLRKEEDRLNVIAFLTRFNADGTMRGDDEDAPQCE
jgi:cytochrome c